jgi:hypothetical protein
MPHSSHQYPPFTSSVRHLHIESRCEITLSLDSCGLLIIRDALFDDLFR